MGFFADRRRRKAEAARARTFDVWEHDDETMRQYLADLSAGPSTDVAGFMFKRGEVATLEYTGALLVEPRRQPGHYTGGYSGFSFKVAAGVRYHVGGSRGTYVPGAEVATVIDTGAVTITNQRVAFRGSKHTREWLFSKMLGWTHDDPHPITYLQVSNREKTSGFGYEPKHAPLVRFRFAWALALCHDTVDDLRSQLEAELRAHQALRPPPANALPS